MPLLLPCHQTRFLCLCLVIITVCACKKSTDPTLPTPPAEPIIFNLTIAYRSDAKAIIGWDETRVEPTNKRTKYFKVLLDSQIVVAETDLYHHEFKNLKGYKSYKVKIISTIEGKDPLVAEITLPPYEALAFQVAYDPNVNHRSLKCLDLVNGPKWAYYDGSYLQYVMPGAEKIHLFAGQYLVALDTATGRPVSSVLAAQIPTGEPVWNDTKIIYPSSRRTLICINKSDGAKVWETNLMSPSEYSIGTMNESYYFYRPKDGPLTAYDINTGAVKWTYDLASPQGSVMPAVANNILVVATDRQVFGLGASDGTLRWSRAVAQGASGRAVTINDSIAYVPSESSLWAFDLFTGNVIWQKTDLGLDLYSPAMGDGWTFAFSKKYANGSPGLKVTGIRGRSGTVVHTSEIATAAVEPVIADKILYYQSDDGKGYRWYPINSWEGPNYMHGFAIQDGPAFLKINGKPVFGASSGMKQ
jgi:outer membrane protein assembly factor BamB